LFGGFARVYQTRWYLEGLTANGWTVLAHKQEFAVFFDYNGHRLGMLDNLEVSLEG
jgi:hypothetical protein